MMRRLLFLFASLLLAQGAFGQEFSHADSLRGSLRPERECYDVNFYDLRLKVDPAERKISGSNEIFFTTLRDFQTLQIDLFRNMHVDAITFEGQSLQYRRDEDAIFVEFPSMVKSPYIGSIKVDYSGVPTEAARAPWDGGFVWKKDNNGKPWVGVACEGTGASLWWPNKDYLGDEPDSIQMTITAPIGLKVVCNGQQRSVRDLDAKWTETVWAVTYPINNYNVTVNIADYVHFSDTFHNASGVHPLDYYVLRQNEAKARVQFEQVKPMMRIYERHFGEYPFWEDGYALVETPYLGMEHQGAIAYGNHYLPGYDGFDPLDLKFDYIIIHETGHEWWGNSVSCSDHAELWIHESFCTYSEAIYVEAIWGKEMAQKYLMNQRRSITNLSPIVGPLGVNFNAWAGSDMYYKGAWMLHTLRNQVDNDELWWEAIHDFALAFKIKNTNTREVMQWFNTKLGQDYTWLFEEYLYQAKAPVLEYQLKAKGNKTQLKCRWNTTTAGFRVKVPVILSEGLQQVLPVTNAWQKFVVDVPMADFKLDATAWYGKVKNLTKQKK